MKKQRIFADFGLNIIASGILNFVLQLVIYPFFAGHNSTGEYGTIVTIMGIANILIATLGNSLNNTRLIQNRKYTEGNHTGDFNLLAVTSAFASLLITYCINFIFALDLRTSLALILYTFFGVLRAYYIVVYRLVLDFKRLLYCNLVICGGYFVGLLLAYHAKCWPIAFAFGEITGCIYLFLTTSIIKENYKRTPLLKATISKYFILIGTTLIGNLILYMDRLIIYPVLGADSVAIYTTASVFGKSFGVVMIPIAGV